DAAQALAGGKTLDRLPRRRISRWFSSPRARRRDRTRAGGGGRSHGSRDRRTKTPYFRAAPWSGSHARAAARGTARRQREHARDHAGGRGPPAAPLKRRPIAPPLLWLRLGTGGSGPVGADP